jgi:hypothetical protein
VATQTPPEMIKSSMRIYFERAERKKLCQKLGINLNHRFVFVVYWGIKHGK